MLSVGIIGLPNVGKSTLFNVLTAGEANVSNYPFTTIEPNVDIGTMHRAKPGQRDAQPPQQAEHAAGVEEMHEAAALLRGTRREANRRATGLACVLRALRAEFVVGRHRAGVPVGASISVYRWGVAPVAS